MESLVGYTGFVGNNIAIKHRFDELYNSKNISKAFGSEPDLLVYAGVPAEMFLANSNPEADKTVIESAVENIRKINPKQLVLISTIAVLDNPVGVDERVLIDRSRLTAYGLHRLILEDKIREVVEDCHIIRLPALFGEGLKKNFIYDIIHFFPALLNKSKFEEFYISEPIIGESYTLQKNGFYKLKDTGIKVSELKTAFTRLNFSALNFTDSRSTYQFYNLSHLWVHIERALQNDIPLLHLATEPISASDIYSSIYHTSFSNELDGPHFQYDFQTQYAEALGSKGKYIFSRNQVLGEIKKFVEAFK